jgi:predicted TIM-barrel fold metal-dependent hydrolase
MIDKIIDAHVHMISPGMVRDSADRIKAIYPQFNATVEANMKSRFGGKSPDQVFGSIKDQADTWLKALDENGIDRAVFFPISERPEEIREFVGYAPDRFLGYAFINNPALPSAPEKLRTMVKEHGAVGLKLYPCIQMFNACDEALFPLYEEAQSLKIPITFHFGITLAPIADYRYTNQIDLQLPLRLFPDLNIIVAHFGAGYFREVCLLGFHCKNIHLDTSGTNNWRDFTPERMPLEEVYKRAVEIYSPERILFGTDTVMRKDSGYRTAIKAEQTGIVENLKISDGERRLIMGGNAARLFLGQ